MAKRGGRDSRGLAAAALWSLTVNATTGKRDASASPFRERVEVVYNDSGRVNALDYLARYCILSPEQEETYR